MRWNERRFVSWAENIGPSTCKLVTSIINSREVVQQSYPTCLALLNLTKGYGKESLERICTMVFEGGFSPTLTNVRNLLAAEGMQKDLEEQEQTAYSPKGFVRKPSYFKESVAREVYHDQE